MNGKDEFISYVKELMETSNIEITEKASLFWEALQTTDSMNKPLFTENGKKILSHLQSHPDTKMWKARDIASDLFLQSRSVSGTMRKLVSDGYVERLGKDPIIYALTEKGINTIIDEESEN